jgi:hypothetical protein
MLIGSKLRSYEFAQMWSEDEQEWSDWMDIPVFITIGDITLSICWQKFNELAIENGRVLSFSLGGSTVRWLYEGIKAMDSVLGAKVASVSIGREGMSIENKEIEIWTDLLIFLDNGLVINIFNALDENGIEVINENDLSGEYRKCI